MTKMARTDSQDLLDPRDELVTHLGVLRAFALSLCRNPSTADDLVQETVMKAWKSIASFEQGTNMRAWLFTILRNTYYTAHRKSAREISDTDGHFAATLSVKPDHDGKLAMTDFMVAFDQLPDEQREALTLVGASGFAYHEAAEMCGVATGTMKSRVNRARLRLVELLDLSGDDSMELTDKGTMAVLTSHLPVRRT
jgi:RNA polymerase sigma-70 factor (ECF subfamily)